MPAAFPEIRALAVLASKRSRLGVCVHGVDAQKGGSSGGGGIKGSGYRLILKDA